MLSPKTVKELGGVDVHMVNILVINMYFEPKIGVGIGSLVECPNWVGPWLENHLFKSGPCHHYQSKGNLDLYG